MAHQMLVFNARKWLDHVTEGGDVVEDFWEICTVLEEYVEEGELLATVRWPDGTKSSGHIVNAMRFIE